MNQDSELTQRLSQAQLPIHKARSNMVWHLEWYGEDDKGAKVFRVAQFEIMRAAHEYISELAGRFNQLKYSLSRL